MTKNYLSPRNKKEFVRVMVGALGFSLAPLFRMYHDLRNRAQIGVHQVTIQSEELASSLGYSTKQLQTRLRNLKELELIDFEPEKGVHASYTITFLVY